MRRKDRFARCDDPTLRARMSKKIREIRSRVYSNDCAGATDIYAALVSRIDWRASRCLSRKTEKQLSNLIDKCFSKVF